MRRNLFARPKVCTQSVLLIVAMSIASISVAQINFDEVTITSGISFSGRSFGASWGDLNGDSYPDLWTGNHRSLSSLYLNNTNGTFTNVIPASWTNPIEPDGHGTAWADFDNDGDMDLLQASGGGSGSGSSPNILALNNNAILTDEASSRGIQYSLGRGRTPLWLDWNSDGELDVYLSNLKRGDGQARSELFIQNNGIFQAANIPGLTENNSYLFSQLSDLRGNGIPLLILANQWGYPAGVFEFGANPAVNLRTALNIPTTTHVRDVAINDFDGDLRPDLFMARLENAASEAVLINPTTIRAYIKVSGDESGIQFQTSGSLIFRFEPSWEISAGNIYIGSGGYNPSGTIFSLSPADASNEGIAPHTPGSSFGAYIGYEPSTQVWTVRISKSSYLAPNIEISGTTNITNLVNDLGSEILAKQDKLLLNTATGFVDATVVSGLTAQTSCESVASGDFDNDMDIDIYLVCRNQVMNLPNILYENLGGGAFVPVANAGGAAGTTAGRGDSVAMADFDNDGFLDLFITNGNGEEPFTDGPYQLFRNRGNANHWIALELEGVASNRDGIGAKVIATAGGVSQLREQNNGMHRIAQNDQRIHFGLAGNSTVSLHIFWPSGAEDIHDNVAANGLYRVTEGGNISQIIAGSGPTEPSLFISDLSVAEDAGTASFNVSLSPTSDDPVTVDYATADGTAFAGVDYNPTIGTLLFNAGESSQNILVDLIDDTLQEGNETFRVTLTGATNALLGDANATGTIIDNEVTACGEPTYNKSIDTAAFVWKDCDSGLWYVRLTAGDGYTQYIGSVDSDQPFTTIIPYSLEASDIFDVTNPNSINYTLSVSPLYEDGFEFMYPLGANVCFNIIYANRPIEVLVGAARTPVSIPFDLNTLGPCGVAAPSVLSVADLSVDENAGIVDIFVDLSPASAEAVTVDYMTANGNALAGNDYDAEVGTLLFNAGETSQPVSISIIDNALLEGYKTFTFMLSNPTNAEISSPVATVTILDDEISNCPTCHPTQCAAP